MPQAIQVESFSKPLDPPVRGFLHRPQSPNGNALILTHGAGGNAQAPLLIALAETFCAGGFTVLRAHLPFRQTRSFGPPGPADAARDRAGLKNAVTCVKGMVGAPPLSRFVPQPGDFDFHSNPSAAECQPIGQKSAGRIFLAGHSYGGRQSSILCSEEPDLATGLLLFSYPLHPPRKPEQQRTQHLPDLHTPTLFVHGTRDPFGTIEELQKAIKMIPAHTRLLPVEGEGHDLGYKGKSRPQHLMTATTAAFREFFRDLPTEVP